LIDFVFCPAFGDSDQDVVFRSAKRRQVRTDVESGSFRAGDELVGAVSALDRELFKKRLLEGKVDTVDFGEALGRVVSFAAGEVRHFTKALWANQREISGCPESQQSLVGADVARRFFSTNVLFAGLQIQHETSLPISVGRSAGR
jgi:hypothetical protein